MTSIRITREDWDELAQTFREFFADLGVVTISDDELVFDGGFTGLAVARNGSSRSFMPLHDLSASWDRVDFAADGSTVKLEGDGLAYTYRVPPGLRD